MTQLANQVSPAGLGAPGLQQRAYPPVIAPGSTNVTITATATSVTISVNGLALINGGEQTTSFNVAVSTAYQAEGSGITATGPATANPNDVISVGVGASTVTFNPNGLKANGQTGTIPLFPYNTYVMTYNVTSGWK